MKKFKKGDFIDCYTLKDYEVIKFENHYLMVKENENSGCKNCFFNTNECNGYCGYNVTCTRYCSSSDGFFEEIDYEIKYEEISEIEALIFLEDEENEYEKNNRRS